MYGVVWHLWLTSAPHCLVPTQTHQVREDEIFPSAPKPTSPLACSSAVSSSATLVSLLSRSPRAATLLLTVLLRVLLSLLKMQFPHGSPHLLPFQQNCVGQTVREILCLHVNPCWGRF